jgi:hypothetical protein
MSKLFINYRRSDSAYAAHQIYAQAVEKFGCDSVMFDVDSIPLGVDFRQYLDKRVRESEVLLAIIGDDWLRSLDQHKDDPKDFVRLEIAAALEHDVTVIPVLVGAAAVPDPDKLPHDIADLAFRNAAEVRAGNELGYQLGRLIESIDRLLNPTQVAVSAHADTEGASLRFDGIYQSVVGELNPQTQEFTYRNARFFEDGTLMVASAYGTPTEVASWLSRDNYEKHPHGEYQVDGNKLSYSIKINFRDTHANVVGEGIIDGDWLTVRWVSHANGVSGEDNYKFIPVKGPTRE